MANKLLNTIRKTVFWIYLILVVIPFAVVINLIIFIIIVFYDLFSGDADEIPDDIKGLLRFEWVRTKPDIISILNKYKSM